MCMIKPHKRCWESPHFEPVNAVKAPGKVLKRTVHLCALQLPAFFLNFSLICRLWSPTGVPPSTRTIITLVCDRSRVAGKEMNSKLGLQGLEYYLVQTKSACSSLHSFTQSDWCWQFPQMKLCQGNTWSMALAAQLLTSIRPPKQFISANNWEILMSPQYTKLWRNLRFTEKTFTASSIVIPATFQYKSKFEIAFEYPVSCAFLASGQCYSRWAVWQGCRMCSFCLQLLNFYWGFKLRIPQEKIHSLKVLGGTERSAALCLQITGQCRSWFSVNWYLSKQRCAQVFVVFQRSSRHLICFQFNKTKSTLPATKPANVAVSSVFFL